MACAPVLTAWSTTRPLNSDTVTLSRCFTESCISSNRFSIEKSGVFSAEKTPLFSIEKRLELIQDSVKHLDNVTVSEFKGLVVDHAVNTGAHAIIRGLRHVSDFEFEFQMAIMNFHLNDSITSLFMMPDEKFIHLNSTVVKDVSKNGGDVSAFVPSSVEKALFNKFFS